MAAKNNTEHERVNVLAWLSNKKECREVDLPNGAGPIMFAEKMSQERTIL